VIVEYAKGLLERGHDVRILYPRPKFSAHRALRSLYLRIRYGTYARWLVSFPGEIRAYRELTPELVGRNDAVIGVGASCALTITSLPDACGVKVHNCHGRELDNLDTMREAWRLRMPRIVVASYLEREMREQGSREAIYVVHNGVDRTEYHPTVAEKMRSGVGSVFHGAFTKGPDVMLAVIQSISKRRPETPLMMFSSYPRPRGLPPGTRYLRLPSVPMARAMYSKAEVWFCASRSEGFPGPVLEAMGCGCAVVSTDCGGTADQIENGLNGFLVPVDSVHELTDRILALLNDPCLRKQIVAAANTKLADLTWSRAVLNLETAVEEIVAQRPLCTPGEGLCIARCPGANEAKTAAALASRR